MKQGAAANLQKAPARTFDPKVFKPSASKPAYTQPATKSVSNKVASGGEKFLGKQVIRSNIKHGALVQSFV